MSWKIHYIITILLLFDVNLCWAWRGFWKGRRFNGNLGDPFDSMTTAQLPPDEWFEQELDHFDAINTKTWNQVNIIIRFCVYEIMFYNLNSHRLVISFYFIYQRFFTNATFYKPGGPVFLMIGGEGEATAKWMVQGAWIHYASQHNALCFQLEHRFYGKSHPTE